MQIGFLMVGEVGWFEAYWNFSSPILSAVCWSLTVIGFVLQYRSMRRAAGKGKNSVFCWVLLFGIVAGEL